MKFACFGAAFSSALIGSGITASSHLIFAAARAIAKFADCINEGRNLTVFGDGEQSRDFVYVGDVARTNFAALQSNLNGACNVGTSNKTSLLDLIAVLSKVAGKTSEIDFASTQTGGPADD